MVDGRFGFRVWGLEFRDPGCGIKRACVKSDHGPKCPSKGDLGGCLRECEMGDGRPDFGVLADSIVRFPNGKRRPTD